MNYEYAERQLTTARNRSQGKPYGSSTRLVDCEVTTERFDWTTGGTKTETFKAIGIRYHETIVVAIMEDGRYRITTGGWWTKTTRERIEQATGRRVWSVTGPSFDTIRTTSARHWRIGDVELTDMTSGIIIDPDGSSAGLIATIKDLSTPVQNNRQSYYSTTGAMRGYRDTTAEEERALYARYAHQTATDYYRAPQPHEFNTQPITPEMDMDASFSMRFDEMNEEAEKEMAAWSEMLKGGRK